MEFKDFKEGVSYRPLGQNTLLVELLPETKLHLLGKCQVLVLKGSVDILGFELLPCHPSVAVYSPKGHSSLLTIQPVRQTAMRSETEMVDFLQEQQKEYATGIFPEDSSCRKVQVLDLKEKEGSVIALMGFDNRWSQGVRKYCADGTSLVGPQLQGLGREINGVPRMNTLICKLGFRFLTEDRAEEKRTLEVPSEWNAILNSILRSSDRNLSIAAFGGKGVGKSTLNRWLCNKLQSKFTGSTLFVDLDPGQTELTPPGVLSVSELNHPFLGPNFTHLQEPLKAVYLGTVNVADEPHAYINGVKELARFINASEDLRNRHIVLNTMGFCSGLGVHLAVESIKIFQPKSVIQIRINNRKRCFPFLLTSHNVSAFKGDSSRTPRTADPINTIPLNHKFFELESACSNEKSETSTNPWGITPKVLRENTMVSYFAGEIGGNFLGTEPKVLSMEKVAFGCKSSNFSLPQVLDILNGNLVALCGYPEDARSRIVVKTEDDFQLMRFEKGGVAEIPIQFFGYGIARGIDVKEKKIFILTPVSLEVLANSVNCVLGAGTIGMPASFYGSHGPTSSTSTRSVPGNRLHSSSKRQFVPNRASRSVLTNCLL